MTEIPQIREWRDVDARLFREEIAPLNRPAVLKGLVADWPAVREGRKSPQALAAYLKGFDRGKPAQMIAGDPAIKGKFFYRDDMSGFNFQGGRAPIGVLLDSLIGQIDDAEPPALALQSTSIPEFLPGFEAANRTDVVDPRVIQRIWIGNAITVVAHCDLQENIACVVGGRRRFTLFPPEQTANLYIGPLEFTPAGAPVSLVDFDNPDLERHPRYAEALTHAETCEVEAGDAVYIPYLWWHHVRSLERFNVLVNYWWNAAALEGRPDAGSPFDWLLFGLLTLRELPPSERAAWRAMFDYYVFQTAGDPVAHIPEARRGVLGKLNPAERQAAKTELMRLLAQWAAPRA